MKIQMTLFDKNGKYKPIATVITVASMADLKENFQAYKIKAINKIACKRYLTGSDLIDKGYTILKYRPYGKEDKKQAFIEQMTTTKD